MTKVKAPGRLGATDAQLAHAPWAGSSPFSSEPLAIRSDGLVTTEQAAELCGVRPVTVRQWTARGILPVARREKRRLLLNLADVARAELLTRESARRPAPPTVPAWKIDGVADTDLAAILTACRARAEHEMRLRGNEPVVYYIRFADRIKIGTSSSLLTRLQDLPCEALLATEPGDRLVESVRHGQFAQYRLVGEWFSPGAPLLAHIATLQRAC